LKGLKIVEIDPNIMTINPKTMTIDSKIMQGQKIEWVNGHQGTTILLKY